MQNDLQIFIIWSKALPLKEKIIKDIEKNFEIKKVFSCHWPKELFSWYLVNFYHKKLYHCCKKEKDCGNDDFLLIVVNDTHPEYKNNINIKMKNLKQKYRDWAKGSFLIHASDNKKEAEENLSFLTNMDLEEFSRQFSSSWDNKVEPLDCPSHKINKIGLLRLKLYQFIRRFI